MACDTDCRVDYDANSSLLDWHQQNDCLPLVTPDVADSNPRRPIPKPRSKNPATEPTFSTRSKIQKWKIAKFGGGDDSDHEQLISDTSRDETSDVAESHNVIANYVNTELESEINNKNTSQDTEGLSGRYQNIRSQDEAADYSTVRDLCPGISESSYLTATDDAPPANDSKVNIPAKLQWAEEEVERSLQQALEVINKKKIFLLDKLEALKKKKENEDKERERSKTKTPIQVLQSPRASPAPNTDSETESDSVFVRKKVIKTDKRKMELKLMADIDSLVTKAEKIALAVRKVNFMTPFLVAKVNADVEGDEESPDLVDVMAITISDIIVVMTTDFKNSCLKSFRHVPGEMVSSVLRFDNSPWGVTRMDLDTVAVSIPLANKLCLVDMSSGLTLKETVKTKRQYYGLVSIGSGLLVATSPYSTPRSVDTIDLSGSVLKTLVIDTLLQQPSFICSTPTGSFVISDLSKGTLLGVSNSLEVASGFEREGEAHLMSTRGVTTNQDGDVFVVDYQQKKVKVFSGQGLFLKDFLTTTEGLKYPYGVCFDDRGHIYVTDGGVIKIFSY